MTNKSHDCLILGSGIAGLRASTEAARINNGIEIAIIPKGHNIRSHPVHAENSTPAAMNPGEGDSFELHAWDILRNSDLPAGQDVVELFVQETSKEMLLLEHRGIPWSRRSDGRIARRSFGSHTFDRVVFVSDKTGFFEVHTLYDTLQKFNSITRYDECCATSILTGQGIFQGLTIWNPVTDDFFFLRGKTLIIATGGARSMYGVVTYSRTATGDGMAMAHQTRLPLEDMEFIQFHATGLVPSCPHH